MERFVVFHTPFEWCGLVSGESGIKRVLIGYNALSTLKDSLKRSFPEAKEETDDLLEKGMVMIVEYLCGKRLSLDIPYDLSNGTPFQMIVWEITRTIPYGETRTYSWLSRELSRPMAFRAVGQTLGSNPLPLIVPCHRVVRSDGKVGGFSLPGGSCLKDRLIELEMNRKRYCVL